MRALLGILLLFLAFAAAALWQGGRLAELRAARGPARSADAVVPDDGRVHLVIGRPSGSPPLAAPPSPAGERRAASASPVPTPPSPTGPAASEAPGPGGGAPPLVAPAGVFELRVRPGQTLSGICQEFYGTSRGGIVERVAQWNGLTSPDRLRAGDVLELPPWESLGLPPRDPR